MVPVDHLEPAQWLVEAITMFGGRVDQLMPGGYERYLRVFHRPDQGRPGLGSASWAETAARQGTVFHAEAQWTALTGAPQGTFSPEPMTGSLDPLQLRRLCELLPAHTTSPERCHFALWDGTGASPRSWDARPRFSLPHRRHWLFAPVPVGEIPACSVELEVAGMEEQAAQGEVRGFVGVTSPASLAESARWHRREGFVQSPSWWWPEDRAWVIHSEVDYDSTLVAGSSELCSALLADAGIECLEVGPATLLTAHADQVNSHY